MAIPPPPTAATLASASTTAGPVLRLADLADPAKYRTIRAVPIFDEHPPVEKTVASSRLVSPENPRGLFTTVKGATRADLEAMAANSNERARSGRFAPIQLGHNLPYDAPEHWQPRAVGFGINYAVAPDPATGVAHLVCDLAYRADEYPEAATYHSRSIDWCLWQHADRQYIGHIALLRSEPGRDLVNIAYAAGAGEAEPLAGPAVAADALDPIAPTDLSPPPTSPPNPAGNPRMNPEELQTAFAANNTALISALTPLFTGLTESIVAALKPAAPAAAVADSVADPDLGDPAGDLAYSAGMAGIGGGAAGGNAVFIPGVTPPDAKHRPEYLKACRDQHGAVLSYGKVVPAVQGDVAGLKSTVGGVEARLAALEGAHRGLEGSVRSLVDAHDLQTASYRRDHLERILDGHLERGVQLDRERELTFALGLPDEKQAPYLEDLALHYKSIPLNAPRLPTGGGAPLAGKSALTDLAYRNDRLAWMTRTNCRDQRKADEEFSYAAWQGGKR